MSVESDFYAVISGYSTISDLVSDRVYPAGEAPHSPTLPYVVYERIATEPQSGIGGDFGGLERVDVAVDCFADLFDDAVAIAEAVCDAVDAETGANNFRGRCSGETDSFDSDLRVQRVSLQLILWHRS